MTVSRVEWQYVEGVKSLFSLTEMLRQACTNAGVPVGRCGANWNDRGLSIRVGGQDFWLGIYMDRPEQLVFQCNQPEPEVQRRLIEHGWEARDDGPCAAILDLLSESAHFFSLAKDSQLTLVTNFIKSAYDTAKQCAAA